VFVDVVRMGLRRERVSYSGKRLDLPLPDGPGKALKLSIGTVPDTIPVYIAAVGPKNTALTAEIADGWLPIMVAPEHMGELLPHLREGWQRAGRDSSGFDIAPTVTVRVDDDLDAARDLMRGYVALYVGGMGSREKNFYNRLVTSYGFGDAAREVQDLYLSGRKEEAMAALPAELIDAVTLCGPADRVRERLQAYRDAGVGTLICSPMAWTLEDRVAQLRAIAELTP
jgi:alkanesulfonate monooxygenase SsuD/methylene tetrahydromethanopterin reductase-like flavin-dependent oxidoreductase (luciferase family)